MRIMSMTSLLSLMQEALWLAMKRKRNVWSVEEEAALIHLLAAEPNNPNQPIRGSAQHAQWARKVRQSILQVMVIHESGGIE